MSAWPSRRARVFAGNDCCDALFAPADRPAAAEEAAEVPSCFASPLEPQPSTAARRSPPTNVERSRMPAERPIRRAGFPDLFIQAARVAARAPGPRYENRRSLGQARRG